MKRKVLCIITLLVIIIPLSPINAQDVPPDILQKLKETIEKEHPDNFSLQKMLLDGQINSYLFLQAYTPPTGVPAEVVETLKAAVALEYPDNYSTQKMLLEGQVKSYIELHKK